jgi:type I restriction-modification system DNA methylase subunit
MFSVLAQTCPTPIYSRATTPKLAGKKFKAAIESPYRWRDWAAKADGPSSVAVLRRVDITSDELLAFINNEETTLPSPGGAPPKRGAGLFRYLHTRTSSNGDDRRDVIATVFKGVDNRMKSGYLLRDVVNKIAGIHFTSSDELHTLGALYESMLREMRDAASDSAEFYNPRAVMRFMLALTECLHTATRRTRPRGCDPHQIVAHRKVFGGEVERGIQGNFPEDKQTAETALL